MNRRAALTTAGSLLSATIAGCLGFELQEGSREIPPVLDERPDAVYMPTHFEGMVMEGMQTNGPFACALTYTLPHRFWTITGTHSKRVDVQPEETHHLMPLVWERETGIIPPDLNPHVEIKRNGQSIASFSPWSMVSQPMGFHFGDNITLPEEASYDVSVRVGQPSVERTYELSQSKGSRTFEFTLDFDPDKLRSIEFMDIPPEKEGSPGAIDPMEMEMLPSSRLPDGPSLPGENIGTAVSGDGHFHGRVLNDATPFGGGSEENYLYLSAQTPYNRYPLVQQSLSVTINGNNIDLKPYIDETIGFHYGTFIESNPGENTVSLRVKAPPQVARHEGYETAFIDMPDVTLTT